MTYKYRNVKTNEVIITSNKVSGKNWVPIEDTEKPPVVDDPHKDDVIDETPEDDSVEDDFEEETVVEEAPATKPKATRRGKK